MLHKLPSLLAIASLLVATALAAPAFEAPAVLAPRQDACPTTSRWKAYTYFTEYLSTVTATIGHSSLGSITSTKTKSDTRTSYTVLTIISPAVTTLPASTTTLVIATVTSDITWRIHTSITTSPGYAPTSACQVTTVTNTIPSTTSVTYTSEVLYIPTTVHTTGHVTTETEVEMVTVTRTVTRPGATTWAATVTELVTTTTGQFMFATEWRTVWERGCREWACRL